MTIVDFFAFTLRVCIQNLAPDAVLPGLGWGMGRLGVVGSILALGVMGSTEQYETVLTGGTAMLGYVSGSQGTNYYIRGVYFGGGRCITLEGFISVSYFKHTLIVFHMDHKYII